MDGIFNNTVLVEIILLNGQVSPEFRKSCLAKPRITSPKKTRITMGKNKKYPIM
jgi:hypothetical protein